MVNRLAPFLLAFSLVGGCAAGQPGTPSSPAVAADERIFALGFSRIADIYLTPVQLRELTLDGLAGLTRIDTAVSLTYTDERLRALSGGKVVAEERLPKGNSPRVWAAVAARVLDRLRLASPRIAVTDREEIYQAVFDSILADLDPYSRYTGTLRADDERALRDGFGGVGIVVRPAGSRFEIMEVLANGPSARAGLRAGDLILAVDDMPIDGWSFDELGNRLRGPVGSSVWLSVGPDPERGRRVQLRRDRVVPNTVIARIEGSVGILRVERFNAATALNLRESIRKMRTDARITGLILDLRSNPGGLLDQAVAVADEFMTGGRIISTKGRHPDSVQHFDAAGADGAEGLPLVVLLDGHTASAAEIVAAALQDSGRAVLVGTTSFGKGSVQTVTRLPNDGELFLTWSRLYAPSGYTLHQQGVQPTVCTSRGIRGVDDALRRIRQGDAIPSSAVALWRARAPEDADALNHLRQACPWEEHAPELDVEVAKALLGDGTLYRRALMAAQTHVAER